MPNTRDIQARLLARGYNPGVIDGLDGPKTQAAKEDFQQCEGQTIESDFHSSGLHRVVLHWTAGAEGVIALERKHYHFVIDQDGSVVEGLYAPEDNAETWNNYAAHTANLNTGSIGVALDGMAGADDFPFDSGPDPINMKQLDSMATVVAKLSKRYDIPVHRATVLSHAEVPVTLGVPQPGKWDIRWLPWMSRVEKATHCGDILRRMVRDQL
jgi:peptidoglycan hydrolase-like protein with peptidoglycan-binding domain